MQSACTILYEVAEAELPMDAIWFASLSLIPPITPPTGAANPAAPGGNAFNTPPLPKYLTLLVFESFIRFQKNKVLTQTQAVVGDDVDLTPESDEIDGIAMEVSRQAWEAISKAEGRQQIKARLEPLLTIYITKTAAMMSGEFTQRRLSQAAP